MGFDEFIQMAIIFFVWSAHAQTSLTPCNHQIFFLPQTHPDSLADDSTDEEVARSQFKVAKFILTHPNIPVFAEGVHFDSTLAQAVARNPQNKDLYKSYQKPFKSGLPQSYENLTSNQRNELANVTGVLTMLFAEQLHEVHKTAMDPAEEDQDFEFFKKYEAAHPNVQLQPGSKAYNLVYTKRERFALEQINSYFKREPQQKQVVLVFGAIHDFNDYPDLFPPKCVIVPFEFQTDYQKAHAQERSQPNSVPNSSGP